MGTEKRERQKAGRAARVEAALAAQKRAENRRRMWWIGGTLLFVVVVIGVLLVVRGDDSGDDTATTVSTSTITPVESAAGKPCVGRTDELPPGAPEVPVKTGPPPTELVVEDLVEGEGEAVPEGATVTVHYIGVSCSTGAIFDSSYESGETATFPLSGVISGWGEGIPGMKVGGRRLLGIPPDQAYGTRGMPPNIAPDETLWFVVDLQGFEPPGSVPSAPVG